MVTSKQKQRLGDRVAGTFVVSRPSARALRASGTQIKGAGAGEQAAQRFPDSVQPRERDQVHLRVWRVD